MEDEIAGLPHPMQIVSWCMQMCEKLWLQNVYV